MKNAKLVALGVRASRKPASKNSKSEEMCEGWANGAQVGVQKSSGDSSGAV
jgi:hypothetical protein